MGEIWSDQRKLEAWKKVEVVALEAFERRGKVPAGIAAATEAADCPTPQEVADCEAVTNHDLAAFVDVLGQKAGEEAAGCMERGRLEDPALHRGQGGPLGGHGIGQRMHEEPQVDGTTLLTISFHLMLP